MNCELKSIQKKAGKKVDADIFFESSFCAPSVPKTMESVNYQKRYHTAFWNATMFIYFCGCVQALAIIGDVILIFRCPLNIIKSSNMKCTKSSDSFQFLFFWSPYQKSPRRGGRDDSRDRRRRWRVASGWDVPLSPGRVTLPTSAQRAAGGGLPLFFPGRTSGDAKPGSDGVLFFTACAMKAGEVTSFGVAQRLWSFVCRL